MRDPKYGRAHDVERAKWKPLVDAGRVACWRCRRLIPPGAPWDLGHNDAGTGYLGPEHARCNRQDGGRKRHRMRAPKRLVL